MKDLVVVGAGPSGSICAMHAAKLGMDVALIDRKKFPRFKSCGGALSLRTHKNLGPKGLKAINCYADGVMSYSPKHKFAYYEEENMLTLVSRTHWDHQIYLDALDAGVNQIEEKAVKTIEPNDTSITVGLDDGTSISGKYVVIADGTGFRSYKSKLGFTQPYEYMARSVCTEFAINDSEIDEMVGSQRKIRLFFGVVPRGYGWFFEKRGYLNIGIGFSNQFHPDITQFQIFDNFVKTLKNLNVIPTEFDIPTPVAHPLPFKKPFEPTGIGSILLVGDAGGFVSPVTGEGLYYGTTSGRVAAEAICDDLEGNSDHSLVESYDAMWMNDFGEDMIENGLPLANLVYKSKFRMELLIKMMISDEETRRVASRMICGTESYGAARKKIFRRAPLSVMKTLGH
jgi:geranylgeranyl reductase family protein